MNTQDPKPLYIEQPCERCGSKKHVSKTIKEEIKTSFGVTIVETSQITCTNSKCQAEFDTNRVRELVIVNNRKLAKEENDKIRKASIAKTIEERKRIKMLAFQMKAEGKSS